MADVNVKDKTLETKLNKRLSDFLADLRSKVKNDDDNRASWKNKMITASNQRLGVRRYTSKPYPGAPNIPLPETDKLIKKAIPNLTLSAWAPKRICTVKVEAGVRETPPMKEKAKRCERAMNMLLRTKIDWFKKLYLAANNVKQYGHCVFRIIEEFKSRIVHKVIDLSEYPEEVVKNLKTMPVRELKRFVAGRYNLNLDDEDDKAITKDIVEQFKGGEKVIEFDVEEISSLPNVEIPLPTKIIVPAYATDINTSPRVTYEYFLTKEELEAKANQGIFKKSIIDRLDDLEWSGTAKGDSDIIETSKARSEGVIESRDKGELYRIHEVCCWYKPKKNAMSERWVFTFLSDVSTVEDALIQEIPFPFEFEDWNYEKCDNEIKDPRYHSSRGVPEQIRAIQEILERCINNLLIRDEMNNTPMWEVLNTSELLDAHIHFVPGEKLPVTAIGQEIRALNEPITVDISSERIMQLLKAYAEEYQGSIDQLFRNATNVGGGKTLGEVKEGVKATSGPINVEVITWNETLSGVYKKIFDIMKERMGDSIFIEGMEITKEDFNFPAEVRSNGTLEVADKELMTFKAQQRLQIIISPVLQDIVNSEDKYNALKDWLEKDGVKDPEDFCTDPRQIAQSQIAQLQQQVQQMASQAQTLQQENLKAQQELAKVQKKRVRARIQKAAEAEEAISELRSPGGSPSG